jgi:hypothetical protein
MKPVKPKSASVTFKHSARTFKKPQNFAITKMNCLAQLKKIIAVYTENHKSLSIQNSDIHIVKADLRG